MGNLHFATQPPGMTTPAQKVYIQFAYSWQRESALWQIWEREVNFT